MLTISQHDTCFVQHSYYCMVLQLTEDALRLFSNCLLNNYVISKVNMIKSYNKYQTEVNSTTQTAD